MVNCKKNRQREQEAKSHFLGILLRLCVLRAARSHITLCTYRDSASSLGTYAHLIAPGQQMIQNTSGNWVGESSVHRAPSHSTQTHTHIYTQTRHTVGVAPAITNKPDLRPVQQSYISTTPCSNTRPHESPPLLLLHRRSLSLSYIFLHFVRLIIASKTLQQ